MGSSAANKILFSCTGCGERYTLTRAEVMNLPDNIALCTSCRRNIKIAFCPSCGISYSITFSVPRKEIYPLSCRKCRTVFNVSFPVLRKPIPTEKALEVESKTAVGKSPPLMPRPRATSEKNGPPKERSLPAESHVHFPRGSFAWGMVPFLVSVFNPKKLAAAAVAVAALFVLLGISHQAESTLQHTYIFRGNIFLLHLLNLLSIFAVSFALTLSSAILARITISEYGGAVETGTKNLLSFTVSSVPPLFAGNAAMLLAINGLLIVFGSIPPVNPFLYAFLFLPIYLLTVAIVLIGAVALWLYPPVMARHTGTRAAISSFIELVRINHLKLLIIVPAMAFLASLFTALLNLVNSTLISLILSIFRSPLGDSLERVLSLIPPVLRGTAYFPLKITGLKSLGPALWNLIAGRHTGGVILVLVMVIITAAFITVVFSFIGTLSARVFLMLETGRFTCRRFLKKCV